MSAQSWFPARDPEDDDERDAPADDACFEGYEDYCCTRTLDHEGDHVAHTTSGKVCIRWPRKDTDAA